MLPGTFFKELLKNTFLCQSLNQYRNKNFQKVHENNVDIEWSQWKSGVVFY